MESKYDDDENDGKRSECKQESKEESKYNSDDEESDEDDDEMDLAVLEELPKASKGRRNTVTSAPITVDPNWSPPVYEKSAEEREAIHKAVDENILFRSLEADPQGLEIICDAMQQKHFEPQEEIITQGQEGDMFYILEEGSCEVFVEGVGRVMQVDGDSVNNYFGELALLHDAPRAATVKSVSDVRCWALDRTTFKKIMFNQTTKTRRLHGEFLSQVPILSTISEYERLTIADALMPMDYAEGEMIVSQGQEGNDFYIIADGEVKVTKDNAADEVSRRLGCGDYFGELALLSSDTRQATVTAVKTTKCLRLDRRTFKRLLGPLEAILKENAELYGEYVSK
jgi:cAMP-dependent protein kinase regulator